jgi:competence protein ComEA
MSPSDRILLAAGGGAVVLAIAAAVVLLGPAQATPASEDGALLFGSSPPSAAPVPDTSAMPTSIVVDVAGAVAEPGLRELPAGARIGDAIAAAGGYATDADLDAAAAAINLARLLADGDQVRVPRIGEIALHAPGGGAPGGAGTSGGDPGGGGLVNLNTATPEQLEALPGIGPVTVQKIVAARQEQPFTSLDDALQRGVIHRGQLEDIQGLATAG